MILLKPTLHAFVTVAELSSVSAAAKKLGLTQTGVTQRIKGLEKELEVSLFTRSRLGMKLTTEGQALLRCCLEANNLEGRLLSDLHKGENREIDISIVGSASLITGRATHQCREVMRKWPKLNLHFVMDVNANRLGYLKKGTADFAFLLPHEVSDELDSKLVKPLEFILVATSDWKNRHLKEILEEERLYAYYEGDSTGLDYLQEFDLLKHKKKARLYVNENLPLLQLLESGAGYGVLAKEIAKPLLDSGRLLALNQGKSMKVPFALAWYPRQEMPDYFREIIGSIK
ncbi:MAG: LysR family transcriptional regulator [Bdellovibrionota bacterium]